MRPDICAAPYCHIQTVLGAAWRALAACLIDCATDAEDLGFADCYDNAVARATVLAIVSHSDVAANRTAAL